MRLKFYSLNFRKSLENQCRSEVRWKVNKNVFKMDTSLRTSRFSCFREAMGTRIYRYQRGIPACNRIPAYGRSMAACRWTVTTVAACLRFLETVKEHRWARLIPFCEQPTLRSILQVWNNCPSAVWTSILSFVQDGYISHKCIDYEELSCSYV